MDAMLQPGGFARRVLLHRALLVGAVAVAGGNGARAAEAKVEIDNFTFEPASITVAVGTTVTWVNHDDIPHSVVCLPLGIKSPVLDSDESFAYRFERAGIYEYICGLHPHMRAQVVVQG